MRNVLLAVLALALVADQAGAQTCGSYYANGGNGGAGAYAYSPYGNGNGYGADVYDAAFRRNGGGRGVPRVLEFRGSDGSYLRLELANQQYGYRPAPNYFEHRFAPAPGPFAYPPPQYYAGPQNGRRIGVDLSLYRNGRCPTCP